ncbi:LLM class flavin-dependent oxidoreductase [Pseudonocardia sp. HH130630-07]|uniref:LLM class flavin-dependent oxidoreductase n=1 Tax=Pseudonocardia sp. HH130630-07 TaxID=1690815 RepID=UPI0008152D91|nr:LLM class flavin-dependent oxidoreductase [Pseudonocardia sp. HH130630-07]ANY09403.1 alkane 1-monooxygenase [Pseudonocardia sp. HH130630-07]
MSLPLPLSILDLATVTRDESVGEALEASTTLAQRAEEWGFRRIWYAEHHNMRGIASAATSVLIAHVAARTERITLGSGGVMLPNHSPLQIAEQFGTLAELHPGRIELGLGRAPGTDQETVRALRRDPAASERFPQDVQELQGFLGEHSTIPNVAAYPGRGTGVPLFVLGSSLYGAQVAAALGLPYAFASHFAPDALQRAVALYRAEFRPSAQLSAPRVLAGVNVIAADSDEEAQDELRQVQRQRVRLFAGRRGTSLTDAETDVVLDGPAGDQIRSMTRHSAVGTPDTVTRYLEEFAALADADELIVAGAATRRERWWRSWELLASKVQTGS